MKKSTIIIHIILIVVWPIAWLFIWEFIKIRFPVYLDEIPYPMRHPVDLLISVSVAVMPYCVYGIVKSRLAKGKRIKKSTIILLFIWPIIWCFIWKFYQTRFPEDIAAMPHLFNIIVFVLASVVPYNTYELCTVMIPEAWDDLINTIKGDDAENTEDHSDSAACGTENEDKG